MRRVGAAESRDFVTGQRIMVTKSGSSRVDIAALCFRWLMLDFLFHNAETIKITIQVTILDE